MYEFQSIINNLNNEILTKHLLMLNRLTEDMIF
jgi:hypothetical protein